MPTSPRTDVDGYGNEGCDADEPLFDVPVFLYVVVCEDGHKRHAGGFDTLSEAMRWEEWEHCCTNGHKINRVPGENV